MYKCNYKKIITKNISQNEKSASQSNDEKKIL